MQLPQWTSQAGAVAVRLAAVPLVVSGLAQSGGRARTAEWWKLCLLVLLSVAGSVWKRRWFWGSLDHNPAIAAALGAVLHGVYRFLSELRA